MNRQYKLICDALTSSFNEATPTTVIKHLKSSPWSPTATAIKQELKPLKKQKNKTNETRAEISKLKKALGEEIKTCEDQLWKEKISKLTSTKAISQCMRNHSKPRINLTKMDTSPQTSTDDPATILKTIANTHFPGNPDEPDRPWNQRNKINTPVTEQLKIGHLNKAIKQVKRAKAPGVDNITNGMLIDTWDIISHKLRLFMLNTLTHRMKPDLWLKSKGIIIPKPGKSSYSNPKSYRVICLSSNILKLMERGLLIFLHNDLNINMKLIDNQHGFRKGKSTISAIHDLTSRIENALADKQYALGAFVDVEGAFDKVSFTALERGLDKIKLPPELFDWISHSLRNRTVILELGGECLEQKIYRGTPQGGILSPLLWNLCMNTIQFTACNLNLIILYADDIVIIITGPDLNSTMHDIIVEQMNILTEWVHKQGLKLSTTKTNIVAFHNTRQKITLNNIKLGEEQLPIPPPPPPP
eukprot:sb/3464378/